MSIKTRGKQDSHAKLIEVLHEVDRPCRVCAAGDRPLTMPGLEVNGLGVVRLPLGDNQARKLIEFCRQAPYGKGAETVVDTDVRRVWELDPDQFRMTNPRWDDAVASIVEDVQQELGLEDRELATQLYKLLLYEEGSFFLPHRDGEKLDRMVATLVIGLPAYHEGGELIVSHEGRQHEIVFTGAASGYDLSYAGFYADCQHEVKPVRTGYRLCLTYNVALAKSRARRGVAAPSYGATAAALQELLLDWQKDADAQKLAIILDHRYTQDGLSLDNLKGVDRARAEVLFEAAAQSDCAAHLALLTLWQSGSAEGGYDEYSYGNGRGYSWSDDEDEEDHDETSTRYEMGEIFDHSLTADHWSDRQGRKVRLGEIHFNENEIVAEDALDEGDPNREDFEGYTGNAGMTLERWYHRAAIVIWPKARHFHVLCSAGTNASIGGLEAMVEQLKEVQKAARVALRQDCLAFAAAIIDSWQSGYHERPWQEPGDVDRNVFASLLCELDAPDLVRRFLSQVMISDGKVQICKSLAKLCKRHGWASFEPDLAAVIEAGSAGTVARNAALLQMLCAARDKNSERIEVCTRLSDMAVNALEAFDERPPENDWRVPDVNRSELLVSLVKSMLAIKAARPLRRLIDHTLACSGKYDLTAAHLTAIFALESRLAKPPHPNPAISHWLAACRRELKKRTTRAPQKPADYRRTHELSCDCSDCAELSRFLANPNQCEHRFAAAKERRRHLHQIIDSNRCDCTHWTERRGRPYTLVCTKTTASYDAACKTYERDLQHLSCVLALEKKIGHLESG